MRRACLLLVPAVLLAVGACSDDASPAARARSTAASSPGADGSATVTVGSVGPVRAEVADSPEERAVGLMDRASVPPGTGMVFLYDAPSTGRFYMFHVGIPLTAVFASEGEVVGVVDMPPCPLTDPAACPTYGPDAPFDTVLETAPETVEGKVAVGDALTVAR
ncbi:MAG: hypothetical protein JWO60_1489 [Frankiales bacterium]|nr:hypothetical protein [Frankiales bacterium]